MLCARLSTAVSLCLLMLASTCTTAALPGDEETCEWYCRIERKINKLIEKIDQLTKLWLQNYPTSTPIVSTSASSPADTESFVAYTSSSFGTPYSPTPAATDYQSSATSIDPSIIPPSEATTATMGGGDGYRTVAYFTNWGIYGRQYPPQSIPSDKLTHVLYAFGDNREDGEVILTDKWSDIDKHYEGDSWNDVGNNVYGNIKQLQLQKKEHRNMKALLSIGGWTYTNEQKHFDVPASSPAGRKRFADSCVNMIKDLGFDGIDIDWEYPTTPEQGQQLLALLHEIRNAMNAYADQLASQAQYGQHARPDFVLSIAAPAGQQYYKNYPLREIGEVLDFVNVMAYDFSGGWDSNAGHTSNLYPSTSCPTCTPFNINSTINAYIAAGVPSDKLVLGMPLYGRSFANTDGIGTPFQGVGSGSWEAGSWDYKALPQPGATVYTDEESGAQYSYDSNARTLISYDTLAMANKKAQYIKDNKLGGAMWWELSGDKTDDGSIVKSVVRELGGYDGGKLENQPNWLYYPDSQYDNLREGFRTK